MTDPLEIASAARAVMLEATAAAHPREACGLLFGSAARIDAASVAENVADDPLTTFEIDPQALIDAHRAARNGGAQVIGCWHSHPNGRPVPSAADAAAAASGTIWLVLADGDARAFAALEGGFTERSLVTPLHNLGGTA